MGQILTMLTRCFGFQVVENGREFVGDAYVSITSSPLTVKIVGDDVIQTGGRCLNGTADQTNPSRFLSTTTAFVVISRARGFL